MWGTGLGRFVWRNAVRNKRRTALTVLSTGFSLFLLMALLTVMDALFHPSRQAEAASRLIVTRSTSVSDVMPLAYLDKIRRIPNVEYAASLQWFNGIYRDPTNQFPNFATDPESIWGVYTEAQVLPEEKAAFIDDRTGAIVGQDLMDQFGWKVGDRITLMGTIFPVDLELTIVGTFRAPTYQNILYFRHDYLEEALGNPGMVGAIVIRATNPEAVPLVSEEIDSMFRNSPAETRTTTERAFVLGFVSMLGNVQVIMGSVAAVVVFTMLLVSTSTMAMTVRERLREMAILKAIGYTRRNVLFLIMAEAVLVALMGVLFGVGLSESLRLVDMDAATQGFVPLYSPTPATYAMVVAAGLAIGLFSGLFPAWRAANTTVMGVMQQFE